MKNNLSVRVFLNLFRRMGISALWYIGIFAIVMASLHIIFKITEVNLSVAFTTILDYSDRIYTLVIGVVYPLVYLSNYFSAGITRKNFAVGLFASASALSICFSILRIPVMIIDGGLDPLALLISALYCAFSFLIGLLFYRMLFI